MICVATWFDSADPTNRTRSLELWMGAAGEVAGTLYESRRYSPADVWEPAQRLGVGQWSRSRAAAEAAARGLVSLVEYPGDDGAPLVDDERTPALAPFAEIVADAERQTAERSPLTRSQSAARAIAAALVSLPADPRDALLELHGTLVALPGYCEGDDPTLDAILTELERRIMAAGAGHSVRA